MRDHLVKTALFATVFGFFTVASATALATDDAANGPAIAKPQTVPTTQPIPAHVTALIQQLGDETYAKREQAAAELKKLGNAALPGLTQASSDENPQIRTTAQALVTEIRGENKTKTPNTPDDGFAGVFGGGGMPGAIRLRAGGNVHIQNLQIGGNGAAQMKVQMIVNGETTRDTTIEQNGQKVHIHEDSHGIKMEVTEKGETKETKASDADDLKKNHPEEFKLYEQYNGKMNGAIRIEPLLPRE